MGKKQIPDPPKTLKMEQPADNHIDTLMEEPAIVDIDTLMSTVLTALKIQDSKKINAVEEEEVEPIEECLYESSCIENNNNNNNNATKGQVSIEGTYTFDNLKALFNAHLHGISNIMQLYHRKNRINLGEIRINGKGLEAKMHLLLNGDEEEKNELYNNEDFKKDEEEESTERSFLDLLKECNGYSDDDYSIQDLKIRAVNHGINLSRLVIDLMLLTSIDTEIMMKMEVTIVSLKWVYEGETSVVITRIFELILTAEKEIHKLMKKEYDPATLEEEGRFQRSHPEEGLMEGSEDEPMLGLLREIFRFECFWMHRRWPCRSNSLKDALPLLVADIKECEDALKVVEDKAKYVIRLYSGWYEEDFDSKKRSDEYKAMELRMNELWSLIEESEN